MDSPDIDFSLVELKKNPKTCSNLVIIDQFSFLLHCQYQFKSFFKIKYFLGNQIEATKEEIKVLVS